MTAIGEELLGLERDDAARRSLEERLDRACLYFCVSLLDHTLRGDLFESTAVGFLAALGVDPEKKIFRDASSFTSYLSAFVKMSQMLVI